MTMLVKTKDNNLVGIGTLEGSYVLLDNFLEGNGADSRTLSALNRLWQEIEATKPEVEVDTKAETILDAVLPHVEKETASLEVKIVSLNLDEAKELLERAPMTALDIFAMDPHSFSNRPCQTCATISKLIKQPFGCTKL